MSEVRLQFQKGVCKVKGVIARISNELLLRDVVIQEVIYSMPDVLVYVSEEKLVDAHKSLMEIKN